ncbi:INO80 complex subunit C-like [Artemia franciscana]|uniref:Vps72/YL1 C-terminal domain-containing protein n=1 Tax=Artemia franciscana TaxID=6661 RepID=A0AA88HIL0_ARTSF|nr:hypothetical protein QYM36_013369 [Artemia franciscana]
MSNQKRTVKPLKYMLADKMAPGNREYLALESPPSHMPVKRYSDISGLEAKYTDPTTKLRYSTPEEYSTIQALPSDIVSGYLALRKSSNS